MHIHVISSFVYVQKNSSGCVQDFPSERRKAVDRGDGKLLQLSSMRERSTDTWFGMHPYGSTSAQQELGGLQPGNAES